MVTSDSVDKEQESSPRLKMKVMLEAERKIALPYYPSTPLTLTVEQQRVAHAIATGHHVVVVGPSGSGKTIAIREGLSRCHVVVPSVHFDLLPGWLSPKELYNYHAGTHGSPLPCHDFVLQRAVQECAQQEAEDREHAGRPRLQIHQLDM